MKRVLMVAYHFPPLAGSSGIQRTLRFVQHLPKFDWEPLVLSADPLAYERTSNDLMAEVPESVIVKRSLALDTARHLSIFGRYVAAMARPDRWVSWKLAAVLDGLRMIRKLRPSVIWSTYPIATAHLIGAELHRRTGLPWIADFRDPMAQEGYPVDPATWNAYKKIEETAAKHAAFCIFTTPGAAALYKARYPDAAERIVVLENGYDEETFASQQQDRGRAGPLNPDIVTLLHSGIVYPDERDPTQLFVALRKLKDGGGAGGLQFRIRFRAAVHDDLLKALGVQYDVSEYIELCPPISYRDALAEMLRADVLLVMQAANCNAQIPAKIYEYLRAGRPIAALTDSSGDTAGLLRNAGIDWISPLDDSDAIASRLLEIVHAVASNTARLPLPEAVASASRLSRSEVLVQFLERCTTSPG
ncbi:glycosyltransferase [Dechloromonas sp. A34]|uniref:glycosyltransferase n=1 Tax=Dechloromonas sp. A34 TaxID=447588 RepID=UPI002249551B|nr:glycosyltransferase [Dechloromonas sp. A34]